MSSLVRMERSSSQANRCWPQPDRSAIYRRTAQIAPSSSGSKSIALGFIAADAIEHALRSLLSERFRVFHIGLSLPEGQFAAPLLCVLRSPTRRSFLLPGVSTHQPALSRLILDRLHRMFPIQSPYEVPYEAQARPFALQPPPPPPSQSNAGTAEGEAEAEGSAQDVGISEEGEGSEGKGAVEHDIEREIKRRQARTSSARSGAQRHSAGEGLRWWPKSAHGAVLY